MSFGNGCWSSCLFNFKLVYLLLVTVAGESKQREQQSTQMQKEHAHPCTQITKTPHWPMYSAAAIHLRSPSSLWQGLLAMWPLLLNYDYLYYPITALCSGHRPVLEDTGTVFYLTPLLHRHFSCLLRNIRWERKEDGQNLAETKKGGQVGQFTVKFNCNKILLLQV